VLEACPNATVVSTMWGTRYMLADFFPPFERMRWLNDGESFSAGDRTLHAVRPPVWDGVNTRGLYDTRTGVYWAADAFSSLLTHPVTDARELDHDFWKESFLYEHRSYCEWLPMLDADAFDAHIARTENLARTIASAHGPVLSGDMVGEAYGLLHQIVAMGPVPAEDQSVLDGMIAAVAAAA
jgi:flavorubredoxin